MDSRAKAKIMLIILILSFTLLLLIMLLGALSLEESDNVANNIIGTNIVDETENNVGQKEEKNTIEKVLAKYKCQYINESSNVIYLKLGKDLYSDNGTSNEPYFIAFVNELTEFFVNSSFKLVDEEKNVTILVEFNAQEGRYIISYNNQVDFYEKTDGKSYVEVEKSEIIKASRIFPKNQYLEELIETSMYFTGIEGLLTERKELESGYIYFPKEHLKVKLAPNNGVMNIVFNDDYEGLIWLDVDMKTSIAELAKKHPDYTSGGVESEYLGYRNGDLYYFFYEDEVSVYGYRYNKNDTFEEALKNYLDTKDLDKFYKTVSKKILSYDVLEYDPNSQSLYMLFPTRGIEIDIQGNNPKGITLYSSYYFSDDTRQYVKDGLISFKNQDLVQIYEKGRRNSK